MGGRLDSTNVVQPVVSVITTISFDHTRQLGKTLGAIATEKAGILKRGRPAVSGVRDGEAAAVDPPGGRASGVAPSASSAPTSDYQTIAARAALDPPRRRPGRGPDLADRLGDARPPAARPAPGPQRRGRPGGPRRPGRGGGLAVGRDDVDPGLRRAAAGRPGSRSWASGPGSSSTAPTTSPRPRRWPRPSGPASRPRRRTLVFGTTRDKDLRGQLRALLPLFDEVIATRYVENPRSLAARDDRGRRPDAGRARPSGSPPTPPRPWTWPDDVTAPDGLICVTGSLFLAAEARAIVLASPEPRRSSAGS